ncbi:glycosyltransferase 87 family protein [Arthrobacter castelli]|uniref:glycosyltransferase 87 family protein n=1 Tax=Arthrobacter castelli TaxID=271431 RepID=UPI0006856783|nr:glycosyltransferase 87 family protein [Arthrobacter castelli]
MPATFQQRLPPAVRRSMRRPRTLLLVFVAVHLGFLMFLLPLIVQGDVLSDVAFYRWWAFNGLHNGNWVGLDKDWVYPIAALLPMLASMAAGYDLYQLTWWLIFTLLNAAAVLLLTRGGRRVQGFPAAYWWLAATSVLAPVAVGRIDGLTGPMVVAGLMLFAARPVIASAVLALATWIKVWPAAVIGVLLVAGRKRLTLLLTGFAVSVLIAAAVAAAGGLSHLLSFIGAQADRGMQLEAPFTTPGLWQAVLGLDDARVFHHRDINTLEIRGAWGPVMANLMTPLLILAALCIAGLLVWAMRNGAARTPLILAGSLAMVSAFVVFNKVGSPQFQVWLIAVVAVGLAHDRHGWRVPGLLMLVIAALTTLVYPIFYGELYTLNPWVALLLTGRNVLLFVLLGWAVKAVVRLGRRQRLDLRR